MRANLKDNEQTARLEDQLVDPYEKPARRGSKPLTTPEFHDGVERPLRDEDVIERHGGNGRPKIYILGPDGQPTGKHCYYTRVSTLSDVIDDKTMLTRWSERKIVEGMAIADHLVAEVMQHHDSRSEMDRIVLDAKRFAQSDSKAIVGTAVHALTERRDLGLPTPILPSKYRPALECYIRLTQHLRVVAVEKFMVNDGLETGGTPDRIVEYLPCENCGKRYYVADLKTGRVDVYTEMYMAVQLGIYANSNPYDITTHERGNNDHICRCKAIVIQVNPEDGSGTLFWLDIYTGYEQAVETCFRVMAARKIKGLLVPFDTEPNIPMLLRQADSIATAKAIYAEHKPYWKKEHTALLDSLGLQ